MEKQDKKLRPLFWWAGGKNRLLPTLKKFLPKTINHYYEPFVGGGALFRHLAINQIVPNNQIHINDINSHIIRTYQQVQLNPNGVISNLQVHKEKSSREYYNSVRNWDRTIENWTVFSSFYPEKVAARFLYINKTCFQSLWQVDKEGYLKSAYWVKPSINLCDSENILKNSAAMQGINVTNIEYWKLIQKTKKGDLVYFDPPYHTTRKVGAYSGYTKDDFSEHDQQVLQGFATSLVKKGVNVIISNSNTPFIYDLYSSKKYFTIHEVTNNRSIGLKNKDIKELLIIGKEYCGK